MDDELMLCAAAFFRNKGKTVATEEEFVMSTSMDYHWFSPKDAKKILETMISAKILEKNAEIVKPTFEMKSVNVPVAYKPAADLASKHQSAPKTENNPAPANMLPALMEKATSNGIEKKDFISQANHLSKTLNVDMIVAGLLVLRERGIDISEFIDPVYSEIKSK